MYQVLGTTLRRTREARRTCQILFNFLPAIALDLFPLCSNDLFCFANSFGSNSGWSNMERIFLAVHLPAVVSKLQKQYSSQNLQKLRIDRVSSGSDVYADKVWRRTDCSSAATSPTEGGAGMEPDRTIGVGRERIQWSSTATESAEKKNGVQKTVYLRTQYCNILLFNPEKFWYRCRKIWNFLKLLYWCFFIHLREKLTWFKENILIPLKLSFILCSKSAFKRVKAIYKWFIR